ncbi:2-oxoglutarate and iron-dependent oxygenase JMJD4, partial [Geodia barretti]
PCLFSEAATRDWRARQEWQKDGRPNIDYLASQFGDASVPVANCSKEHFNSHRKSEMRMADYLDYWRRHMAMGEAG